MILFALPWKSFVFLLLLSYPLLPLSFSSFHNEGGSVLLIVPSFRVHFLIFWFSLFGFRHFEEHSEAFELGSLDRLVQVILLFFASHLYSILSTESFYLYQL